LVVKDI